MKKPFADRRTRSAFTLMELLVALAVLALLVLLLAQILILATSVMTSGRARMDADSQARLALDRMVTDIAGMLRRSDVDYQFIKQNGNDEMYFYSEAPGLYDGTKAAGNQSTVALVGYRINQGFQLERLGKQLTWDGAPLAPEPGGIQFLSLPAAATTATALPTTYAPDPATTLQGNWPGTFTDDTTDSDYHVLANQVFRFEICFQLKDGSLSTIPMLNLANAATPVLCNMSGNGAPAPSNSAAASGTSGYAANSRWWDATNNRAYICVNSAAGAAVWQPLGMQDVRALVVAIAVLDSNSAKIIPTQQETVGGLAMQVPNLSNATAAFADPSSSDLQGSPPQLMADTWTTTLVKALETPGPVFGLPHAAAAQIRIYQRYLPLNNQPLDNQPTAAALQSSP